MSRPSVNACTTRSGTPSCAASSISASMCSQPEWTPPSETRPIRCRRPRGLLARRLAGGQQHLVLEEAAVGDRVVDPGQVLLDDRAGAEVEVADLGVAHLAVGEADVAAAGRERRVRVALPERVEDRGVGLGDRVARARRGQPPAVEDRPGRARGPGSSPPAQGPRSRLPPRRGASSASQDRGLADREEVVGVEAGAADQAAVDVGCASSSAALSGFTEPP